MAPCPPDKGHGPPVSSYDATRAIGDRVNIPEKSPPTLVYRHNFCLRRVYPERNTFFFFLFSFCIIVRSPLSLDHHIVAFHTCHLLSSLGGLVL